MSAPSGKRGETDSTGAAPTRPSQIFCVVIANQSHKTAGKCLPQIMCRVSDRLKSSDEAMTTAEAPNYGNPQPTQDWQRLLTLVCFVGRNFTADISYDHVLSVRRAATLQACVRMISSALTKETPAAPLSQPWDTAAAVAAAASEIVAHVVDDAARAAKAASHVSFQGLMLGSSWRRRVTAAARTSSCGKSEGPQVSTAATTLFTYRSKSLLSIYAAPKQTQTCCFTATSDVRSDPNSRFATRHAD